MRLENMLDINHELIKLSKHIDWESPDKEWGALFVSTKGAPAIRTRDCRIALPETPLIYRMNRYGRKAGQKIRTGNDFGW